MNPAVLDDFLRTPRIAYFSMEIALESAIPTYSGGLGVLAGDTMRSAADLELPLVGVTLASRAGYFRQEIDSEGRQTEHAARWNPDEHALPLPAKIAVNIDGRDVWIASWLYVIESQIDGSVPVLLLDTDLPENSAEDRRITDALYGGDAEYRLQQEIVLGMGGVRMLRALGFRVERYHLNEGHAALLCLALLRRIRWTERPGQHARSPLYNVDEVRGLCAFTTHTPVEAGHDKFPYELAERLLGGWTDMALLRELGGEQHLNMTMLALNLCGYVNGVARSHAEQSRRMFPGYRVHAVSNGAHPLTWTSPGFRDIYDRHFPHWCHEPEALGHIDTVPDEAVWAAHAAARRALFDFVHERCKVALSDDVFTLCFARRMTGYKRPDLLFSDLERLRCIAAAHPLQIIMAGKAHPHDVEGKRLIEILHRHIADLQPHVPAAYLPGYDMDMAKLMVAGADAWLNTPLPPLEASGTSGMKAAFNGVPSISVLDGWWIEGCIEGVTGWGIGSMQDTAPSHGAILYEKLERQVLPLFYNDRSGWLKVMKGAIRHNAVMFNTHRMMRRYATDAYLRRA
ncbi:MAG TPA: alpha-glucan family phosphorylase [Noviherbaspirillum sp.]|uniref:alpha-glucan family phosphorylase n=1 Tax=Noviherbaspirillum sp. TaxID=1926288 RepID=UPI002B48B05A|nr:alpha-glucan family phosphorylase [Noviherbaspirillum sp.]HJV84432.1 alpha-glucan family phosphorylase [Noviherbaspirillum sp.]